ncbi:hypothetical protein RM545_06470 [Zunongwangia sp. F260]|uniref:DNA-binding protein n=1 Tax=Autumnicola lenta TaxID=3075593 RepID=A0ABU3CJ03_9FLAO|nr:hypothetical protein [Zunongwangia sp. F260]MDT0646329.1 hypothetical protein [Zunongwangia sp. F260]
MTDKEVREIVLQTLEDYKFSISGIVSFKPKMKTSEVAKYLGFSNDWVLNHKELFNPRRKNMRGDYEFDTSAVVSYKMNYR